MKIQLWKLWCCAGVSTPWLRDSNGPGIFRDKGNVKDRVISGKCSMDGEEKCRRGNLEQSDYCVEIQQVWSLMSWKRRQSFSSKHHLIFIRRHGRHFLEESNRREEYDFLLKLTEWQNLFTFISSRFTYHFKPEIIRSILKLSGT